MQSSIQRVPISYFVYSAFSYLAPRHGGELPGSWFVHALTAPDIGRSEDAVRQTLYRMEREGEVETRRVGRAKLYAPSAYARAEIEAGSAKIFERAAERWDGRWTVVHVDLRTPQLALHRERVVALLAVEGFARLDANLFVHPRDVAGRLEAALSTTARRGVLIMRATMAEPSTQAVTARWRPAELARRYARVLRWLDGVQRRVDAGIADAEAFRLRFDVVFTFLGVAWDDPRLPPELLPPEWPGDHARHAARRAYESLLPGAIRHGEHILQLVEPRPARRRLLR